jgi:hypothetical protein
VAPDADFSRIVFTSEEHSVPGEISLGFFPEEKILAWWL